MENKTLGWKYFIRKIWIEETIFLGMVKKSKIIDFIKYVSEENKKREYNIKIISIKNHDEETYILVITKDINSEESLNFKEMINKLIYLWERRLKDPKHIQRNLISNDNLHRFDKYFKKRICYKYLFTVLDIDVVKKGSKVYYIDEKKSINQISKINQSEIFEEKSPEEEKKIKIILCLLKNFVN